MKCIAVYTDNFEAFSDIFDEVLRTPLGENEEMVIEGITVVDSGDVPQHYLERMKAKPEVVVMKDKDQNIVILQHGEVFEIFVPQREAAVL